MKPNFYDNSHEAPVPFEQRGRQFVFVGRIGKLKGVDILLKARSLMGDTAERLIICGTSPMEKWCRDYISSNQLKKIEMTGYVSNDKVREEY